MNSRNLKALLLPLASLTALAGCASAPVPYEVRDGSGNLVVSRAVEIDRPEVALRALHGAFIDADYTRCRALAVLVQHAWPQERQISAEARRTAAWCRLFTYESRPGSISALENEAWNLDILDAALAEFQRLPPSWSGEVKVLERAVEARMRYPEAFDATIAELRLASRTGAADAQASAISRVGQRYPEWSAATGLARLAQFPWSMTENQQ